MCVVANDREKSTENRPVPAPRSRSLAPSVLPTNGASTAVHVLAASSESERPDEYLLDIRSS
jgi:hypothetical protein